MTYYHEKRKRSRKGQGLKNSYYKYIQEFNEKGEQLILKIVNIRRNVSCKKQNKQKTLLN